MFFYISFPTQQYPYYPHKSNKEYNQGSLKTKSDNTVIINQTRMYTRDEVFELLKQLRRECIDAHNRGSHPDTVGIAQFIQ